MRGTFVEIRAIHRQPTGGHRGSGAPSEKFTIVLEVWQMSRVCRSSEGFAPWPMRSHCVEAGVCVERVGCHILPVPVQCKFVETSRLIPSC